MASPRDGALILVTWRRQGVAPGIVESTTTNRMDTMRQAISTKYHGPTNSRGSMVTAYCQAGKVTVPWDYELDIQENHYAACYALASKLMWTPLEQWHGGALANQNNHAYCFVRVGQ